MNDIKEIATTIRGIWTNRAEAGYTGDWMPLRAVRDRINSYEDVTWTREDIDAALARLLATHQARLAPEANRKTLTTADHDAALWAGGQWHHLISFAKQPTGPAHPGGAPTREDHTMTTATRADLIATRDELRDQARQIRRSSATLSGDALRATQDQHRRLMARITQLNEAIRNHA